MSNWCKYNKYVGHVKWMDIVCLALGGALKDWNAIIATSSINPILSKNLVANGRTLYERILDIIMLVFLSIIVKCGSLFYFENTYRIILLIAK